MASGSPWTAIWSMAGPARIAQPQVPRHLVEGLAGGVVDGRAEQAVPAVALHQDEQRVAARHQQHHDGQLQVGFLEQGGVEVGLEVVHGHEGHVPHQGQRLGRAQPHQQRAHQARADGGAHRVDVVVADPGLDQGAGHHRGERLDVGPAGDLGHDPTEAGVQLDLAADHRRQHLAGVDHHGRGRLVTRRLDAEHPGAAHGAVPRRPPGGLATASRRAADPRTGQVGVEAFDPGRGGGPRLEGVEATGVVGLIDVVGPHHQRILARVGVVVASHPGRGEPEGPVEGLGLGVVGPDLERDGGDAHLDGLAALGGQQPGGDAQPAPGRIDRQRGHVPVGRRRRASRRTRRPASPPWPPGSSGPRDEPARPGTGRATSPGPGSGSRCAARRAGAGAAWA